MDLDGILQELGQFSWFQFYYLTLLMFPCILSGFRTTEYMFTTMNIPHRCRIPQCEDISGPVDFSPSWLPHAVPLGQTGAPEVCLRYHPDDLNVTALNGSCPAELFTSETERCDSWVFDEPARTIAHDFKIMCPEDYWKLTTFSSISVFVSFVGIPITGFLSDRIGRKAVMVWGCTLVCVTGLVRSFAPSLNFLLVMEVVDGLLLGAAYAPAYLLGLETLAPSKRLLGSMLINSYFPLGEILLALLMWLVQDWRILQRVFYGPMLVIVFLHWLLPESIRWLHTNGKDKEAREVLMKIAKMNGTEANLEKILGSQKSLEAVDSSPTNHDATEAKTTCSQRWKSVLRSRIIMWRFGVCALLWVAIIFTYYGISQNATYFDGNQYLSFILVSVIEVPAYVFSLWAPDWKWLGRRGSMVWSFLLGGAACLATILLTPDQTVLNTCLFLVGKFCSSYTDTVIYLYTAEVFPTEVRHSLLSLCSMFGRVGTIISQQAPLLALYIQPMLVIGAVSVVGGLLSMTCPETLGTTMPDTIEEAENIGRSYTKSEKQAIGNEVKRNNEDCAL